ncbi:MAG: flagellar protein FhlB [Gammaproteobacteria bacterium]|jgi:flagellar biosynthesis protein|nr:flagellar protein FhlB [Gammaproteobacteria bacterium]MBT3490620.1 flagellar protein FhlB [Gammaproteobacteria bacterium]MBT3718028.1 flagellar protein FhlB [Gammaproteobacteria bacterium]MBT3844887.1 flagellar protein FhlB [Gammaproteobacteria bacterium]MBT3891972.1 flagellar protein FhlB [Gammaproteobacteria bacterium]
MKKETLDLAVALRYEGDGAPRVTATGKGLIAEQIIEIAKEHDVPLYEEPELVQLLSAVELNNEIPETLYIAVAEVIAFAYQLSGKSL